MTNLIFIKTTIANIQDIPNLKGQVLYTEDENKFYYDPTDYIRSETDKIVYFQTEAQKNALATPSPVMLYYVEETKIFYIRKAVEFGGPEVWVGVTSPDDVIGIFPYEELIPTTFSHHNIKFAPKTLATQVFMQDGTRVEDAVKLLSRIERTIQFVPIDTDNQTIFTIPFPFDNYLALGNMIDVTIGSVWVSPERYTIDEEQGKLIFGEFDTTLKAGRSIGFIFWYNTLITNPSGIKTVIDGSYISNSTIPTKKLAKTTNSFKSSEQDSIPTSRALHDMYNEIVSRFDSLSFASNGSGVTEEGPLANVLMVYPKNFSLNDGSYFTITLHKDIPANSKIRINASKAYDIELNDAPVPAGTFKTGDTVNLCFNAVTEKFRILINGGLYIQSYNYSVTALGGEVIIPFNIAKYTPGVDEVKVYQNNLRLFKGINYELNDRRIELKNYTAEAGDMFYFEVDIVTQNR